MKKMFKVALAGALLAAAVSPAAAASTPVSSDSTLYSDLLDLFQAQMAYTGAEFAFFKANHLDVSSLQATFTALMQAQSALITYLGGTVSLS